MGGQRLGGDGAAIGDRELGVRARVAQPIAAGNDRFGEIVIIAGIGPGCDDVPFLVATKI